MIQTEGSNKLNIDFDIISLYNSDVPPEYLQALLKITIWLHNVSVLSEGNSIINNNLQANKLSVEKESGPKSCCAAICMCVTGVCREPPARKGSVLFKENFMKTIFGGGYGSHCTLISWIWLCLLMAQPKLGRDLCSYDTLNQNLIFYITKQCCANTNSVVLSQRYESTVLLLRFQKFYKNFHSDSV